MTTVEITRDIYIPPHKFHNYKEYISKQLEKMIGKVYSETIGCIVEILDIIDITTFYNEKIYFKTTFNVKYSNPNVGELLECEITHNDRITLASLPMLKIIIIDHPELKNVNIGDMVLVKIMCKEIKKNAEEINIVGEYIKKIPNKN